MSSFRWREENGHDDADHEDRLLTSAGLPSAQQPLGELLPAMRNQVTQADQRADTQRRRAARAEARLRQVEWDLLWIAALVGLVGIGVGFSLAAAIIRRAAGG